MGLLFKKLQFEECRGDLKTLMLRLNVFKAEDFYKLTSNQVSKQNKNLMS